MRVVLDTNIFVSALVGGAVFLVSGDSHLLELKTYRGVSIITAREFIEWLDSQ